MSVTATTNKVQYAGAGTTGPFAFNYPVRDQSELDVYVTVDATGVTTLQTITTHYTVSVNDDFSGASVTFVSSVAAGNTVTINRNPALTNENTYNIYDGTFPTVIEEDIDRTSMQDQFLQEQITRSLKAQISDDLDATLPPLVGNDGKYIELVDDGDGTFSLTLSSSTVTDGVTNAGTSTDNAVARFNGTTGEVIQDSGVIIDDSDNITGINSIDIGGTLDVTGAATLSSTLDVTGAATLSTSLALAAGATITEFSIDGTMAGNSDAAVPTEKAVVTYVTDAVSGLGTGDVVGPASATDHAIARFDNSGKIIQNSGCTVDDSNNMYVAGNLLAGSEFLCGNGAGSTPGAGEATLQTITSGLATLPIVQLRAQAAGDDVAIRFRQNNSSINWTVGYDDSGNYFAIENSSSLAGSPALKIADTTMDVAIPAGNLTVNEGIAAGGGTFDASLSAWDFDDSIKYVNNTDYARIIAYGDSSGPGTAAASAFVCIDEGKPGNERVLFFGIGGSSFAYHGGIGAGSNSGVVRNLIGFDLDSAGADVIYMHEDLVCESPTRFDDTVKIEGNLSLTGGTYTTLGITSGVAFPTSSYHPINTESNAATDDLTDIAAGTPGQILILTPFNGGRDVTFKHDSAVTSGRSILLNGGADRAFDTRNDTIMLVYNDIADTAHGAAAGGWCEVAFSNNGV